MRKIILVLLFSVSFINVNAQMSEKTKEALQKAQTELTPAFQYFFSDCVVNKDCDDCVEELVSKVTNEYQAYVVAGALYNIDPKASYTLHKTACEKVPNALNFNLEYALESHRAGDYETAIKHYKIYKKEVEKDYRVDVWLSECYLNLDKYAKAIEHWKAANHAKNHVGIDKAVHIIHGKTDQLQKRSNLVANVKEKDSKSAYELIFLDMNWELDWWNSNIQDYFLEKDMEIIKSVFGVESKEYKHVSAYKKIKELSKEFSNNDVFKKAFTEAKLILDNNQIPENGNIASDLLRIAFQNKLLDETTFFEKRGKEIIALADTQKDIELLNIYAYLESTVTGRVTAETDKKGWNEYNSEKFAISYFIGLADKNTFDNPDLAKALQDFPNSSKIHWVKLNCAKIEGKAIKQDLIAVLKKEFKTLGSDPNTYSYALKSYFYLLENEL
ncbi:tetratricopeptide repeat protein [Kordia jejudonensis]|uniref:tetratricopeptide repeat protein n=1 Tax=Kordia jejudonensis TaxID=1348245 RepID=UPI000629BAFE|nr:hypothetical protein [Kordia jejudonensis]